MGYSLNLSESIGINRAFAINWLAKGVYHTSKHCVTNRYLNYSSCCLNNVSLIDISVTAEQNGTNIIFLQVHDHTINVTREFKKFALHRILKSVNTRNTIRYLNNCTNI